MGNQIANMPISQNSFSGCFGSVRISSASPSSYRPTNFQLIWSTGDPIHQPDYVKSRSGCLYPTSYFFCRYGIRML